MPWSRTATVVPSCCSSRRRSTATRRRAASWVAAGPSAPLLTQQDAFERLEAAAEQHVFFIDDATGRGAVAYHRYDGHWGLITTV